MEGAGIAKVEMPENKNNFGNKVTKRTITNLVIVQKR